MTAIAAVGSVAARIAPSTSAAESGRVLDVSDTLLYANGIQIGMVDYANGYRNRYELVDFQSEPVVPCL